MNFNLDFKVLEPAIRTAITAIRRGVPVTNVQEVQEAGSASPDRRHLQEQPSMRQTMMSQSAQKLAEGVMAASLTSAE